MRPLSESEQRIQNVGDREQKIAEPLRPKELFDRGGSDAEKYRLAASRFEAHASHSPHPLPNCHEERQIILPLFVVDFRLLVWKTSMLSTCSPVGLNDLPQQKARLENSDCHLYLDCSIQK